MVTQVIITDCRAMSQVHCECRNTIVASLHLKWKESHKYENCIVDLFKTEIWYHWKQMTEYSHSPGQQAGSDINKDQSSPYRWLSQ